MKIVVTISGIGSRMRNLGEDRAFERLRAAVSRRALRRQAGSADVLPVADDASVDTNNAQSMR